MSTSEAEALRRTVERLKWQEISRDRCAMWSFRAAPRSAFMLGGRNGGIEFRLISNEELDHKRAATAVPCGPGGTPHDYVPFHFGPRSPMISRISHRNLPVYTAAGSGRSCTW